MFWKKADEEASVPDFSETNVVGLAIGAVSLILLLAGMIALFVFKVNPIVACAMWCIGDLGVGLGLGLVWFGERGFGILKATLIIAAIIAAGTIAIFLLGMAALFASDWIVNASGLSGPNEYRAISALFVFGFITPAVIGFVACAEWIERRSQH